MSIEKVREQCDTSVKVGQRIRFQPTYGEAREGKVVGAGMGYRGPVLHVKFDGWAFVSKIHPTEGVTLL